MRVLVRAVLVVSCLLIIPAVASAQASIAGTVKDASGAVLPGVTVEAASPVLIEKVRSAVTDGAGQYQIVDLRPGSYTMTFTLTGFSIVKRDGVELTGSFTATINAELRVGNVQETITVTGETPIVDVSSTRKQVVLDHDAVQNLPSSRQYFTLARMAAGTTGGGSARRAPVRTRPWAGTTRTATPSGRSSPGRPSGSDGWSAPAGRTA